MASRIIETSSLAELIESLTSFDERWIFRGHGNHKWRLLSTLERMFDGWDGYHEMAAQMEDYSLHRLESEIDHYIGVQNLPDTKLGRLAFLQHHGVPTRLLDFTTSPFIALFFASTEVSADCSRFSVWAVDFRNLIKHSLTVLRQSSSSIPNYEALQMKNHDIFFEENVISSSQACLWVTEPRRANRRLERQRGTFLLSSSLEYTIEDLVEDHAVSEICIRIDIPATLRDQVRNLLRATALDNKRLFGDIDGFARDLKSDLNAQMRHFRRQFREGKGYELA